jgi:hypothetical protein
VKTRLKVHAQGLGLISSKIGSYIPSVVDENIHPIQSIKSLSGSLCSQMPFPHQSGPPRAFLVQCVPNDHSLFLAVGNNHWEHNELKRLQLTIYIYIYIYNFIIL